MSEELGHQGTILEKEQAFGSSLLWQLQSNAYGQLGANAWGQGPVPLYITSNPFIARQHAAIAHAFLRDWDRSKGLDRSEPVYFIDIGAGCGRFAYIFRQELRRLLDMDASLREMKLIAVLSEIVPGTVEYWKKHLYLRRLLKEGAFDVALYDAIQGTSLRLQHSGRVLERGACVNPILATANYLFDTIPQDLFRVSNGTVQQGRVTLWVDQEGVEDPQAPELIPELRWNYSFKDLEEIPFPPDSTAHRVLAHYASEFVDAHCCLPVQGYRVLENIQQLAREGFLLLAGDQGITHKEQVATGGPPRLSLHGTFSVPVDYYALGLFFDLDGGYALRSSSEDEDFVVLAGVKGLSREDSPETERTFDLQVNSFEMQDYWSLINCVEAECPKPSLDHILRLVKLGNYDPPILHGFYNAVRPQAALASDAMKDKLCDTMQKVADRFFPLNPQEGMFFTNLGILCFEMQRFEQGKEFFKRTLDLLPDYAAAWFYKGMCHKFLDQLDESVRCLSAAKALDPKFVPPH